MRNCKRRLVSGALAAVLLLAGLSAPALLPGKESRALASAPPAPDLTIESVTVTPDHPSIGETVTFTVTVKNLGELPADFSTLDGSIDGNHLAALPVSAIGAGAVAVKTFTWKADGGPHMFRAACDSDGTIDESNENNNEKTLAFSVLAPDLAIDAISWTPLNPPLGDKVTFTITVVNQGDKIAGSSNLELFIDGATRGYTIVPVLEAGASANVSLPWTALTGRHIIRAVADALDQVKESDEANNASEATCASAMPDLVIDSFTVTPASPVTGSNAELRAVVKNKGSGNAGPTGVTFYSDDSFLAWVFVGALDHGATATANITWIASGGTPVFKATVDANDQVPETDETNNSRTVSTVPVYPDLVVQSITWSPSAPVIYAPVTITVTVRNQGLAAASDADIQLDIDNNSYIFNGAVSNISVNGTASTIFSWMPRNFTHALRATVDENNRLKESNESNNTLTKTMTSTRPIPTADLIIDQLKLTPAQPGIGDKVTITVVVKNRGTGAAGPSTAGVYLDGRLLDSAYTPELAAGQSVALTSSISMEGLDLNDSYKVGGSADINNTVFETNELNNNKEVVFSIAAPDLVIQSVSWAPEIPGAGETVTFYVTVKNRGTLKSDGTNISYYVDNVSMGKHYIEGIEAGATVTRSFVWAASRPSFVFTAAVDEENQVAESNESNNTKTVSLPAPDLVIDSLMWSPPSPTEISQVFFNAVIRNRGQGRAAPTTLYVYFDSAAPLSLKTGEIGPGETSALSFNYAFAPGVHSIRLVADGEGVLSESNKANNELTAKITVQPRTTGTPSPASAPPATTTVRPATSAPAAAVNKSSGTTAAAPNKTPAQTPAKAISGNISAPPPKWQGILQNAWIIGGVATLGLAAIGLLLIFRKKTGKAAVKPRPSRAPSR